MKKWFYTKILGKKYYRKGSCKCCGRCCEQIYVKHGKSVLQDEELFNKLKNFHKFYDDLICTGKDEIGLIFSCTNLDKETRKCKIHSKRAKICRDYPQEEILMMGGTMANDCGYSFEPIISFDEVLKSLGKKRLWWQALSKKQSEPVDGKK